MGPVLCQLYPLHGKISDLSLWHGVWSLAYKKWGDKKICVPRTAQGSGWHMCTWVSVIVLVHERFHIDHFVIHGICIGSVAAIYVTSEHNPYVDCIVLEGPFISFYNVLCQRTRNLGKPSFPVCLQMGLLFKKIAGINIFGNTPIKAIRNVEVPQLMICGRQDVSSLPKYFDRINDASGSKRKQMVWFDEGAHSHLRIRNLEAYDKAVTDFINYGG